MLHIPFVTRQGYAYFFEFGCMVSWGLSQQEDKSILEAFRPFEKDPNLSVEMDEFRFSRGTETTVEGKFAPLPSPLCPSSVPLLITSLVLFCFLISNFKFYLF